MKVTELLEIDFSKYRKILINSVIVYADEIVTEESGDGEAILVTGYKNNEQTFFTSYETDKDIEIVKNEEFSLLTISRKKEE